MTSNNPLSDETSPVHVSPINKALATVRRNIEAFAEAYQDDTTRDGLYPLRPAITGFGQGANHGWTTGFIPGMQWIAWQFTGDEQFKNAALQHAHDFERRLRYEEDVDTHDIGFLYSLASVGAWRLLDDEDSRATALLAANRLLGRIVEPAGIIQAWGDLSNPAEQGRTIIDSLMNMPLLTWASKETGDNRYAAAVERHCSQLRDHIIRSDNSTYHTYYWDPKTGEPLRGSTAQGANDNSCWARGQAWGIYGFALNHRAAPDIGLLDAAERCADFFLSHLPGDKVPYWDFTYSDGSSEPRDSSAAAIAVCGLFELAQLVEDKATAARYDVAAKEILSSLTEFYTPPDPEASDALILRGAYSVPECAGVDEGTLWGDYFYLEALARLANPTWRPVW